MNIIKKIKYHYKLHRLTEQLISAKKLKRKSMIECDYVNSAKYRDIEKNITQKIQNIYNKFEYAKN